jgi:serine/threonine protein kinase
MPDPDKHRKDEDETLEGSSLTNGKNDQPPSTPGDDAPSSLTEVYLPKEGLDAGGEDSFDRTVLTKSPNENSMGRLGKYDVIKSIGQGGMGVVLKGFDESLERHVAIKVLSRQLATSATARRRFTREGRAVAAVNHPNVITIHAVEEQDGLPFLVMELVEGGSLHERIKKDAPLPLEVVLRFGSQIANGLAAAHAQGVIHRDIKPGNVMLEHQVARVKITDFGLARITMDNSDLTSQGNQLGTPAYMSPEQVHGRDVDDRTDLFSLGCVISRVA